MHLFMHTLSIQVIGGFDRLPCVGPPIRVIIRLAHSVQVIWQDLPQNSPTRHAVAWLWQNQIWLIQGNRKLYHSKQSAGRKEGGGQGGEAAQQAVEALESPAARRDMTGHPAAPLKGGHSCHPHWQ